MSLLKNLQRELLVSADRRREPRFFADQEVLLVIPGEKRQVYPGHVMDWSLSGYRIRHFVPLQRDATVMVVTPSASVPTRVVWTARTEKGWQSGLQIVPDQNNNAQQGAQHGR